MGKTRLAPLGWKKGPFLTVRPAGKKPKPKKKLGATRRKHPKRRRGRYAQYLASQHWQELRDTYLPSAMCCACRRREELQLHHINYSRLGNERTGDLTVLCRSCHEKLHAFLDQRFPGDKTWEKARRTAKFFSLALGVEWRPEFELRLPGRSQGRPSGLTEAQRKARRNQAKKHRATMPKGTEQRADSPPDTTGHKSLLTKGRLQ